MAPARALGVILALAGVVAVVCRGDADAVRRFAFVPGDLWVAVSAIAWGCFSVVQRFRPGAMPPVTRFAAVMLLGILALLPFHIAEAAAGALPRLDLQTAGTVLVVALIPGLGAYMGYARIQRALGAGPARPPRRRPQASRLPGAAASPHRRGGRRRAALPRPPDGGDGPGGRAYSRPRCLYGLCPHPAGAGGRAGQPVPLHPAGLRGRDGLAAARRDDRGVSPRRRKPDPSGHLPRHQETLERDEVRGAGRPFPYRHREPP